MAIHLGNEQPYDLTEDEWSDEIDRLTGMLDEDDDEGAWNWFCEHFPKFMELVPKRRRLQFLAGVRLVYERDRIGL